MQTTGTFQHTGKMCPAAVIEGLLHTVFFTSMWMCEVLLSDELEHCGHSQETVLGGFLTSE